MLFVVAWTAGAGVGVDGSVLDGIPRVGVLGLAGSWGLCRC